MIEKYPFWYNFQILAMAACTAGACVGLAFREGSKNQLLLPAWMVRSSARVSATRLNAKFDRFEVRKADAEQAAAGSFDEVGEAEDEEESDSVLPIGLEDAVEQSAESTCQFLLGGGKRALVEISVEQLENFDVDGAQQQRWDCSRLFVKSVQKRMKNQQIKAIFPDMGAAASIKYQWGDETIKFGSLNDRRPVLEEDDIIVLVAPDYQMVSEVQKIAYSLIDDDDMQHKPLIMWNPQLFSGDVGVGLNVRRVRSELLRSFTTVYSLRAFPTGAIFKRYPGLWKIFLDDKQRPGRYLFVKEEVRKPSADELDAILLQGPAATGNSDSSEAPPSPSFLASAMTTISSFSRFMKSLSQ